MSKRPDVTKRSYRNMNLTVAREMRRLYFGERIKQVRIAEQFGVKPNTVSRVVSGIVWADPEEYRA